MSTPKFLFDVHLTKAALTQLVLRGIDVLHATDLGMKDAPDEEILLYATENLRVIVTCDEDFELYHAQHLAQGIEHGGIALFDMDNICKNVGRVVTEVEFLAQTADYETDLYNQIWRVKR